VAPTLPAPRTLDPATAPVLRWGVLAPGGIARSFASALRARTSQRLQAVASRSVSRAEAFAREFEVDTAYGSYAELVADPAVDVVYVASPHSEHRDHALLAIEAGKPVLVEKAFARNAAEAAEVVHAARAAGVFAMEAMWTRFLPHLDVVRRCLEDELLGDLQTVLADHGQHLYPDGPQRLSDPALAGGALLDLGIYPVSFAHLVLGGFARVNATGQVTDLGVDAQDAIVVRGPSGGLGLLSTTMSAKTPTTASINGTAARLELTGSFYGPRSVVTLLAPDGTELGRFANEDTAHGLHFQAAEVARRIASGETESPLMPLDETVAIMAALDDVRAQVGVRYPGE
jgi:predicted dehydrogenase